MTQSDMLKIAYQIGYARARQAELEKTSGVFKSLWRGMTQPFRGAKSWAKEMPVARAPVPGTTYEGAGAAGRAVNRGGAIGEAEAKAFEQQTLNARRVAAGPQPNVEYNQVWDPQTRQMVRMPASRAPQQAAPQQAAPQQAAPQQAGAVPEDVRAGAQRMQQAGYQTQMSPEQTQAYYKNLSTGAGGAEGGEAARSAVEGFGSQGWLGAPAGWMAAPVIGGGVGAAGGALFGGEGDWRTGMLAGAGLGLGARAGSGNMIRRMREAQGLARAAGREVPLGELARQVGAGGAAPWAAGLGAAGAVGGGLVGSRTKPEPTPWYKGGDSFGLTAPQMQRAHAVGGLAVPMLAQSAGIDPMAMQQLMAAGGYY